LKENCKTKKSPMKRLIGFLLLSIFIISCQEGTNQYKNDLKNGKWVEYLRYIPGSMEVVECSKDSAQEIRNVEYENGYPKGMISSFRNGKLFSEFYLISYPYTKTNPRPSDKYTGLYKQFDTNTYITSWVYYDKQGNFDLEKFVSTGYDEISKDSRFNKEYYLKQLGIPINDDYYDLVFSGYRNGGKTLSELVEYVPTTDVMKWGQAFNSLIMYYNGNSSKSNSRSTTNTYNSNQNQSNSNVQQNQNQSRGSKCSYCNGTGRCGKCNKTFRVHLWGGYKGWIDQNETRPGYIMCGQCSGSGKMYGIKRIGDQDPPYKQCSACDGRGWKYCNECNNDGRGQNLGQCSRCGGTGFTR